MTMNSRAHFLNLYNYLFYDYVRSCGTGFWDSVIPHDSQNGTTKNPKLGYWGCSYPKSLIRACESPAAFGGDSQKKGGSLYSLVTPLLRCNAPPRRSRAAYLAAFRRFGPVGPVGRVGRVGRGLGWRPGAIAIHLNLPKHGAP